MSTATFTVPDSAVCHDIQTLVSIEESTSQVLRHVLVVDVMASICDLHISLQICQCYTHNTYELFTCVPWSGNISASRFFNIHCDFLAVDCSNHLSLFHL